MIRQFIKEGLKGKSPTAVRTCDHALKQFEHWLHGAGTDLKGYARSDVQQYIFTDLVELFSIDEQFMDVMYTQHLYMEIP